MDIYSEIILDNYQNPRHARALVNPTVRAAALNQSCGDSITLDLKIQNGTVTDVGFAGSGCAISVAAMSLLSDELIGKKISILKKITAQKIYKLLGIKISPGRVKCALLGLSALHNTLKKNNALVSSPRKRGSRNLTTRLDSRFHGNDK